jgi:TfoX/Sxy family transcriptional regulator of competence genes
MAFDERLGERVRFALRGWKGTTERRMFGGIAFLVGGNMCCGVIKDLLMLRLGPGGAERALRRPHTREMDFTGRPMTGMVYIEPEGVSTEPELQHWLEQAVRFAQSLPGKPAAKRKTGVRRKKK